MVCRVYRCIKQITEPSNTTRIHLFAHSSEHVPISCNFGTVRFNFVKKIVGVKTSVACIMSVKSMRYSETEICSTDFTNKCTVVVLGGCLPIRR